MGQWRPCRVSLGLSGRMILLVEILTKMFIRQEIKGSRRGGPTSAKAVIQGGSISSKIQHQGVRSCWVVNSMKSAWFCFADAIQHDLDFLWIHWNTHIRGSRHDTIPASQHELFFLPETCNAVKNLQPVDDVKVEELQNRCSIPV